MRKLFNEIPIIKKENIELRRLTYDDANGLNELTECEEVYGYNAPLRKVSMGCRLHPRSWGKGIATKASTLLTDYLLNQAKLKVITASVIPDNIYSEKALTKIGFKCVARSVPENWGYDTPVKADKWIKTTMEYNTEYIFRTNKEMQYES